MSQTADQLARQADMLLRQGQGAAAIDSYRRLLDLQPQRADAWYNLGYLLKAAGRYEEALDAYGRALATGIGDAEEVHLNRAVIYSDHLRRDEEAERELHAALELRPGYLPALSGRWHHYAKHLEPLRAALLAAGIATPQSGTIPVP